MDEHYLFLLLAGGESRRMGKSKSQLLFDGQTISNRIIQDAQSVFTHIALADNKELLDYCNNAHQGPLSGIASGLLLAKSQQLSGVICFPCDTLILPSQLIHLLNGSNESEDNLCFSHNGKTLPLIGKYSIHILPDLINYLDSGERRVMSFIKQINTQIIDLPTALGDFATYNTLEEFERAKKAYQSVNRHH